MKAASSRSSLLCTESNQACAQSDCLTDPELCSCLTKSDRGVAAPINVRRECVVLVCYLQDLPANLKIFH
jgi:hypothetical protein